MVFHAVDPFPLVPTIMKRSIWLGAFVIVAGGAAAAYYAAGDPRALLGSSDARGQEAPAAPPALPVGVVTLKPERVPIFLEYSGTLIAVQSVRVRARVDGYLMERPFEDGSDVTAGDLLYRIDPRPYEATLNQRLAEKRQEEANLGFYQLDVERYTQLSETQAASRQRYDQARQQFDRSTAVIAGFDAQIRRAQLDLEFTEIRAPFDGRLGFTTAYVGDLVTAAGDPLTTLVQVDPVFVEFELGENDLPTLQRRMARGPTPVLIELPAGGQHPHPGRLSTVENELDPSTGTLAMRATIPNPERLLRPGQFVRVRVVLEERDDALLIPMAAISYDQSRQIAYVVGPDDKAAVREITTARTYGDRLLVTSGLRPGDRIIVDNLQRLSEGVAVQPRATSPSDTAGTTPTAVTNG